MATNFNENDRVYGLGSPIKGVPKKPIKAKRAPTTSDKAPLGTMWIDIPNDTPYILTSIVNNSANWVNASNSGGTGTFTALTVNPGNATITAGDMIVTAGDVTVTAGNIEATAGTGTFGGNITSTGGDIVTDTGSVIATLGDLTVSAGNIRATLGTGTFGGAVESASISFDSGTNVLSIFEDETLFTPELQFGGANVGMTYGTQYGVYSRIGNIIVFTIHIVLTAKGSSTGNARISGLPYQGADDTAFPIWVGAVTFAGSLVGIETTGVIDLYDNPPAGGTNVLLQHTDFVDTSALVISGTYLKA